MKTTCKGAAAAAAMAASVALWAPTPASAAVTIGGDISRPGSPEICSITGCDVAQISLATGQTLAPFDGVVVRWRVNGSIGPLALRVVRPAGPSDYAFISTSSREMPATAGVESFATRQPIRAGDYVGMELGNADARMGLSTPNSIGDLTAAWNVIPDGQVARPVGSTQGLTLAYDAAVEPDADHDGFGDETQDECPNGASSQGVCPPPPAASPDPGTQSAAPIATADRTSPVVSAGGRSARLSKGGSIAFFVASSENATGVATASVRVPKLVRFVARTITLPAGARTRITLRLSKKDAALVRRALAKRPKLTAIVALSVKDAAGNPSARKLSLKLRR